MKSSLKVFGEKVDGQTYHDRRAVYVVIPDDVGRVATVVSSSGKLFLPGGGIEAGETPEQAIAREVEEECAQRLRIVRNLGEAFQYFYAPNDDAHFAMHAIFYEGRFLGETAGQAEYTVFWVVPNDGADFFHACHVWAIQRVSR